MTHPMMEQKRALGTVAYLGGLASLLEPFCWSWGQMCVYNGEYLAGPGEYVHTYRARVSDHAVARNAIVDHFLGDWLVMLDTDHEFEPDLVARLLNAANQYGLDVLSGLYMFKTPPHYPLAFEWLPNADDDGEHLQQIIGWNVGAGFLEVGSAGGGCLFVRRSVFDRIRDELGELPFEHIAPFSEDHSFFLRLRRLGIPAFVATHIESNHLAVRRVTERAPVPAQVTEMEVSGYERG